MEVSEPIQVTVTVGRVLDELGVAWLVGGSLASSAHGVPRSTADVDLVAALGLEHVGPLMEAVQTSFYASRVAVEDAIDRHTSFNLIHLETMIKVDVFVPGPDELSQAQIARRVTLPVGERGQILLPFAAPEDIVLQKLRWFQAGGEASERQWNDVRGVLQVAGDGLDLDYLRSQAESAGLSELLERAISDARAGER